MKKKKIISSSIKLLIILVSITYATYAWLNREKTISANNFILKTNSYTDLVLSLDGETYSKELSLNLNDNFKFDHEITGDGINFYEPALKREDGTPITFKLAPNSDYLEFDLWVKASGNTGVFLQDNSYIEPSCGLEENDLIGKNVDRVSSSGNFSRDLIASSLRVAFIDNTYQNGMYILSEKPSLVWAPNKNYEINCDGSTCNANINSTNEQSYKFIDGSTTKLEEKDVLNIKDTIKANGELRNAFGDPMISYIDTAGAKKITVRIWVEGNDRDNVTALTGGMFIMSLNLTAITKQINANIPNVTKSGSTISNLTEEMEYSVNKGLTWIPYDGNNNLNFSNTTVYVRYKETDAMFASDKVEIEF